MKLTFSLEINRKPQNVFPWVADHDKARMWQQNVKGGEIITKTDEVVGTTFKEEMEEGGKSLTMYGEVTRYIKNKEISFHLESKLHVVDVQYTVEGEDEKTIFRMNSDIRWKFPMNIMSLFIGRKIKKEILAQTKSEFDELKRLCEQNLS